MRSAPIALAIVATLCVGAPTSLYGSFQPPAVDDERGDHGRLVALLEHTDLRHHRPDSRADQPLPPAASTWSTAVGPVRRDASWGAGPGVSRSTPLIPISRRPNAPRAPPVLLL
jgi:hypothetical protein